jgi:hypothetical protein
MKIWWKFVQIGCIFRGCSVCLPEGVLILTNLVSIVSEFKDLDGIIYLKAVQARMAKIFNDFHFQIFVQIFVFNSWPKKQHSLYKKSAGKLSRCKKMMGLGFISFDKAFNNSKLFGLVFQYLICNICFLLRSIANQKMQIKNCKSILTVWTY